MLRRYCLMLCIVSACAVLGRGCSVSSKGHEQGLHWNFTGTRGNKVLVFQIKNAYCSRCEQGRAWYLIGAWVVWGIPWISECSAPPQQFARRIFPGSRAVLYAMNSWASTRWALIIVLICSNSPYLFMIIAFFGVQIVIRLSCKHVFHEK